MLLLSQPYLRFSNQWTRDIRSFPVNLIVKLKRDAVSVRIKRPFPLSHAIFVVSDHLMLLLLLHILIHDIFIELLEASELEAALIPSAFLTSKNGGSVETMTLTFLPLYSAPV